MKQFKLCVSLSEKDFTACYHIAESTELAELRMDLVQFSDIQLKKLFLLKTKFIVTCRHRKIDDVNRAVLLKKAIDMGAIYVDIEIDADLDYQREMLAYAEKNHCKTIVSYHNFTITPPEIDLQEIIRRGKKLNPWKTKIVTMANTQQDVAAVLSLYRNNTDLIAFCMGEKGKISRVTSLFLGAEFTYVSPTKGKETAQGQIDKKTMMQILSRFIPNSKDLN